jgi:hypothetical protein
MADMDALDCVIEAYVLLNVAERKAESDEVEQAVLDGVDTLVQTRSEVTDAVARNRAEDFEHSERGG